MQITRFMCPKCHIGELQRIEGAPDRDDDYMECLTCGYGDDPENFMTVPAHKMPPPLETPEGEVFYDFPLDEGVKFWEEKANDGSAQRFTNIPHFFNDGSSFAWGYAGTGPSRFSVNIIEAVLRARGFENHVIDIKRMPTYKGLCYKVSWELGQKFKSQFICNAPKDGGIISLDSINEWLEEQGISQVDD